ncbi:MAG TPA: excinuclease ABC subunit UvrA [Polyangiaceae bacterium]|nr:excinuclease ABC subunit UvrA [Polyangiaceae bacterium]
MLRTKLEGARTHNLQRVDLVLEPGQVVAITGVSGSGKSSLALDTLYAEGQRRFVESFSPYARQFLERLERPPMDRLEPVPAGIAVDRRAPVKSSRSTVATMADLEPYLVALFAREAIATCPEHEVDAVFLDPTTAAERAESALSGAAIAITYPVSVESAEHYLTVRDGLAREGFRRLWVSGKTEDIDAVKPSTVVKAGEATVVVDRVKVTDTERSRIAASVEQAWRHGGGLAHFRTAANGVAGTHVVVRRGTSCPICARALVPPEASFFSYDSPVGACRTCRGFGRTIGVDLRKVIPDDELSLAKNAIRPWNGKSTKWERGQLEKLCKRNDVPFDVPWKELTPAQKKVVLEGDGSWHKGKFPGVLGWFKWLETRTYKMHVRVLLARYRSYDPCVECGGKRLSATALSYHVGGLDIAAWRALEIEDARARLAALETKTGQGDMARKELASRLTYLERVGLGYLTLDRQARTLSGGEAQRVTLTAALGTSLHNALFVLDEPTVGLHPTDVEPLSRIVRELGERGNTVLVIEHDPTMIRAAARVVELGPGAGSAGGRIVEDAPPEDLVGGNSATARALAAVAPGVKAPRTPSGWISVKGARENNLRNVDVKLPLGVVCAVTGPSGSGKSTLIEDLVYRAAARRLGNKDVLPPGEHDAISGLEAVKSVALVDQSPLGRTSRGNAATYTKAWDSIRKLLADTPRAVALGLTAGAFSFNVEGGRCETCTGEGYETVEMQFLADVRLLCPVCKGRRFKEETLGVVLRGKNVAEILESTVDEAMALFRDEPGVLRALGPLQMLGLGYLRLGQPLSTLSGGEAQRLKLARALGDEHEGSLLVLDEPSAGLHADEVKRVLDALDVIVDAGGSVLVVDHDLDVVARSDYVVDLGPDAGARGGQVVAVGTPDELARERTRTGRALRERAAPPSRDRPTLHTGAARPALTVRRAREHNLHDVSVSIPHGALTVVTGPSGSGKSTLAFDVVFAEGQRRFLETLTPYARQFLPTMPRPDVDAVDGVPPSIALEQRTSRAGAKSTVATVTEVAHYLRLLYAKLGVPHCPDHDLPIATRSEDAVVHDIRKTRGTWQLVAPAVEARKGTYLDVFTAAFRAGIEKAWVDGRLVSTDEPPRLKKTQEHTIDLVFSRPVVPKTLEPPRVLQALRWAGGTAKLRAADGKELRFSTTSACPVCGFSVPELDPRFFSFNTAQGKCPTCDGDGVVLAPVKPKRGKKGRKVAAEADAVTEVFEPCPDCGGARLAPLPRGVRLAGVRYHEVVGQSVARSLSIAESWRFSGDSLKIAEAPLQELRRRLEFLRDVGLDYLSLDRAARTLSGGEMQRLRLAAQLGAGLTGALYVLDEPTIGLHPRDTGRLLENLRKLVSIGSTVLVVEHDADTITAADHLIDLGPEGGSRGGRVVAEGTPKEVLRSKESPTGRALAAKPDLREPLAVSKDEPRLVLTGASEHNLKNVDLSIPLGKFVVVAGVSGSGKSTLVRQVLLPALRRELDLVTEAPGKFDALRGAEALSRAVSVDQSPIGRTPRSVPATFLGIWDVIRNVFASSNDAKTAGFDKARFSFNAAKGGRCPTCEGQGVITHEMSFLPDVVTTCPACNGHRFEPQTLAVRYLGKSVGEVLDLTAEEACDVFRNHPSIASPLRTLVDLGAGYVKLGQGSHTLSGGEAQRLKLSAELTATARHERTLYVLDEPTTGLHLGDVGMLVRVLGRLVERGDTLVVIEHHPLVMASADHLVELGPDGGERGGRIVAEGTPREVAKKKTATGAVLRALLG